ncbi:M48 family metalloprotease [Thermoproteota archaeon]
MNVRLRDKNRYEFRKGSGLKANFRIFSHMIIFGKDWFLSLNQKARCSILAHELWHSHTSKKSIANATLILFMLFFGWLFISWMIGHTIGFVLDRPYVTIGSTFLLFLFFQTYGMTFLFKCLLWPTEFQSDEASVRFLGAEVTKEILNTFRKPIPRFWSTYPPTDVRLKRVEEWEKKHPKPVIDYDKLENEIPQELFSL